MYFCKTCGRMVRLNERSCPKCGTPIPEPMLLDDWREEEDSPHYKPAHKEAEVPAMGFAPTLGTMIIFMIPIVGFVMMLVWSFSDSGDSARRRLARACLVRKLIVACLAALLLLVGALGFAALTHSLYYYLG